MSRRRVILVTFLVTALWRSSPSATPVTWLMFRELAHRSTIIVAGVVQDVHDTGHTSRGIAGRVVGVTLRRATLQVSAVVKGDDVPPSLVIDTERFDDPTMPGDGPVPRAYRVYFLDAAANGSYVPTNPVQLSMPAAPFDGPVAAEISARIADIVGAVLSEVGSSQAARQEAIWDLGESGKPHAAVPLRRVVTGPDQPVRLEAAAMLLHFGDATPLPLLEDVLLHRQAAPDEDVRALRLAIGSLGPEQFQSSPAFFSTCRRLAEDGDLETRRAALAALSRSRAAAAISTLAQALVSGDRQSQLSGERGLAAITGVHPPDTVLQAHDPALLTAYWIHWARSQGLIK